MYSDFWNNIFVLSSCVHVFILMDSGIANVAVKLGLERNKCKTSRLTEPYEQALSTTIRTEICCYKMVRKIDYAFTPPPPNIL